VFEYISAQMVGVKGPRLRCASGIIRVDLTRQVSSIIIRIIWLLHNLVEASFDLCKYRLLGDQLKPWELHPLVSNSMMLSTFHLDANDTERAIEKSRWNTHPVWWLLRFTAARQG